MSDSNPDLGTDTKTPPPFRFPTLESDLPTFLDNFLDNWDTLIPGKRESTPDSISTYVPAKKALSAMVQGLQIKDVTKKVIQNVTSYKKLYTMSPPTCSRYFKFFGEVLLFLKNNRFLSPQVQEELLPFWESWEKAREATNQYNQQNQAATKKAAEEEAAKKVHIQIPTKAVCVKDASSAEGPTTAPLGKEVLPQWFSRLYEGSLQYKEKQEQLNVILEHLGKIQTTEYKASLPEYREMMAALPSERRFHVNEFFRTLLVQGNRLDLIRNDQLFSFYFPE